jgi:hypothetical protein
VHDLVGDEAEELLRHRFTINNISRPVAGSLLRSPLALCDAETLEAGNFVAVDVADVRIRKKQSEMFPSAPPDRLEWF